MYKILIVDDNYADARSLASHMQAFGVEASTAHSVEQAERLLRDSETPFDLAILDIILPLNPDSPGIQFEGFNLAERLRKVSPQTRLVAVSAYMPPDRIKALSGAFDWCLQKTQLATKQVAEMLDRVAYNKSPSLIPTIFIIHGHDESTKLALKNYLQNTLKLGEPTVLHEKPSQGRTIIEKFEAYADRADIAFVILTPDDSGCSAYDPDRVKRRARQNVIFELGFFYAKLQRTSGRVILLHKGQLELPSDISGIVYIDISHGIEAAGEEIRRELQEWLSHEQ
jgi:predicted nucleotide-binding protein